PLGSFALDLSAAGGKGVAAAVNGDLSALSFRVFPHISLTAVYPDGTLAAVANVAPLLGASFAASGPGEAVLGLNGALISSGSMTGTRDAAVDAPVLGFYGAGFYKYVGAGPGSPPTVSVTH